MADAPGIQIKPPYVYLAFLLLGLALNAFWRLGWGFHYLSFLAGSALIAAGIYLMRASMQEFSKYKTSVEISKPSMTIVMTGPYQHSRNPIYIAGIVLFLGTALALGNGWLILLTFPMALIVDVYVVEREERYLTEKFGEDYHEYKKLVRRWF